MGGKFKNPQARQIMNEFGWFQTVQKICRILLIWVIHSPKKTYRIKEKNSDWFYFLDTKFIGLIAVKLLINCII